MDLSFATTNSSIKGLYSLVPGVYTEGYENIKASGTLSLTGFVKGIYSENSLPAFALDLELEDGMISYPQMPMPLKDIAMELHLACRDGILDNTAVDFKNFHLDAAGNLVDGSFRIDNLVDYPMKANVTASVDLEKLEQVFPIEGLDAKGLFTLNLLAEGKYDSTTNEIPAIDAQMSLEKGYLKYDQYESALDELAFEAKVKNESSRIEDMHLEVTNFLIGSAGESVTGRLIVDDFDDYSWDMEVSGNMDLEQIEQIYPVEGSTMTGKLSIDVASKGKYSNVEKGRYDLISTSGEVEMSNFNYMEASLPAALSIPNAALKFSPQRIQLSDFKGVLGKSNFDLSGSLTNYLQFIADGNELLKGDLALNSEQIDLNELMSDQASMTEETSDTLSMEVVDLPKNVDLQFDARIDNLFYDQLHLEEVNGKLMVKEGILTMQNLAFNMLGGSVAMNGRYDPSTGTQPAISYDMQIKRVSIPGAFTHLSTVQTFAPMAQQLNGDFSSNFSFIGLLNQDMSPVYESLNGKGTIQIQEAFVDKSKLVSGIAGVMQKNLESAKLTLNDVTIKASLENGRAHVAPFDVILGGQKAKLSGSIGADGSLDYYANMEIEAGAIGQQVNQLLASIQGEDGSKAGSKINLNFNISGTYDDPKILLAGTSTSGEANTSVKKQVEAEVKKEVNEQVKTAKQEAEEQVKAEAQKVVEHGEEQLQQQLDTLKKEITKNLEEEGAEILNDNLDSSATELKNSIRDLFKKKKN